MADTPGTNGGNGSAAAVGDALESAYPGARFLIGAMVLVFTVYLIDQYNPDLANIYIGVILSAMLLVYADGISSFLEGLLSTR